MPQGLREAPQVLAPAPSARPAVYCLQVAAAFKERAVEIKRSFPVMAARALFSVALAMFASVLVATPALGSAKDVIRDCSEDGVLNGHYSHAELAKALDKLPSDLDEYTDCRAVIRSAELRSANKGKGGPAGGDTSPPSAQEQHAIDDAASGGPVKIGGKGIRPGAAGAPFKAAGFGTNLPPLVLAVLVALIGATIAGAILALQRRYPALVDGLPGPIRKLTEVIRDGIARLRR
jgi:hypothetical protein